MDIIKYGKAICYSGYRQGQSPKTEIPTKEQIEEDLDILVKEGYQYIRMYDPNLHARRALEIIHEKNLPLKCMIGIDSDPEENNPDCPFEKQEYTQEELTKNMERNDAEVEKLIELVKEFDNEVLAVSVGNENTFVWGAHTVKPERLLAHAKRYKEALNKPVTFCEGVFEWPQLKELGDYLDFISVHSYPLHYKETIDVAVESNKKHYNDVKAIFPDKQVLFTEVGWTTKPNSVMVPGQACVENQKRYITELNEWLEADQIIGFIFEAFDEPWKGTNPNKSECNWGLYYLDRTRKW
ncbi:MAG: hypothetical protein K2O65_00295 [Lachnospiraceae bacterium]|nr:hypothetical protein [Lachnospiraceae bacterium]